MLNATLIERQDLTDELAIIKIKPDDPFEAFDPGQYVALGLPGGAPRDLRFGEDPSPVKADKLIKRAYSIASSPREADCLEFYIAFVEDGYFTPRLALLKEGDRLFVAKKIVGTFTLQDVPGDARLVLISTGTGIAPYISMIRTPEVWTPGREVCVLHGVRYVEDLAYRGELESLSKSNSSLRYFPVVSREDWEGKRGYVQSFLSDGEIELQPAQDHIFACGNPAMIEDVRKLVLEKGFVEKKRKEPGNFHVEEYW